jgi:hypothetical protein
MTAAERRTAETRPPLHTGGCQCGRVRYALYAEPHNPHICHCRMCQKAFGAPFAPLASVMLADFSWTRGEPGIFRSSEIIERGFCRDCGTPLSYRSIEAKHLSISIGSLDEPARVAPAVQYGNEGKLPWFEGLHRLPAEGFTEDGASPEDIRKRASRQHPDHDTEEWTPRG